MSNFADIVKFSTVHGAAVVDDSVPEGFFSVTAQVVGVPTVYLLKGDFGSDEAQIVGRVELTSGTSYRGSRLKGGFFSGKNRSFAKTFQQLSM